VIEGARLLPWLQEAVRREPAAYRHFADCNHCKETMTVENRRTLGCGFLTGPVGAPAGKPEGYDGPQLTVCIGYSTSLPEVIEASRARWWAEKGQLTVWCDGDLPTPGLRLVIEEMDGQANAAVSHSMKESRKQGAS